MKSKLLYILILIISIAMLSSCIMENSQCPPDGKVVISFSFSTQDNMTRAGHTWGDNLDDITTNDYEISVGEDYDTRIKVKSLRAFICDKDNEYICEITNKTYFELDDVDGSTAIEPNRYKFLGELELTPTIYSSLKDEECKIILVANHTLPEIVSSDNFDNCVSTIFSHENIAFPDGFIPMWGVITRTLTLESQQDLGTIYLLRSAAKVEVKLSDNLFNEGYRIESVVINKYAANGYWFPNGWNQVDNTIELYHVSSQEDQVGCYNPYTNLEFAGNKSFVNNDASNSSVVYLPEMNTNGVAMTVVLSKGSSTFTFNDAIKFAKYESGSATSTTFNVVRNHHYQYTIDKVNVGSSLDLTCVVQPWTLVEKSWDYTDLPAVSDDGHISWSDGNLEGNNVYLNASNPYATFTFGLSAPESATWRAEFVNKKGKQNAFRFTKIVNGVEVGNGENDPINYYMTGNVGEKVTLRVRYTDPNITENNEAYLRILVILSDGRIIQVSELLDEHVITEGGQTTTIKGQEYIMVQTP